MGAQRCFYSRCVAPKLSLVVWTCMENMTLCEMPDFYQILAVPKALQEEINA